MIHYNAQISDGPDCFIEIFKEVKKNKTQKLVTKYGLPQRSDAFMNESGCMDYVTWEKVVAVLAKNDCVTISMA